MNKERIVGIALCDIDSTVTAVDVAEFGSYSNLINHCLQLGIPVEIQIESGNYDIFLNQDNNPLVGVHVPIVGVDVTRGDINLQLEEKVYPSLDFAQINADYAVLHLTQHDNWDDLGEDRVSGRQRMHQKAMSVYKEIVEYYLSHGHNYDLCVEVPLEYPKHPAGKQETINTLREILSIYGDTKIVFDIAHDWHNAMSLLKGGPITDNYPDILATLLSEIEETIPGGIRAFHLGGAYVNSVTGRHETHGIPTLSRPDDFTGEWLNIEMALEVIKNFSTAVGREIPIQLEIGNTKLSEKIAAMNSIEDYFKN